MADNGKILVICHGGFDRSGGTGRMMGYLAEAWSTRRGAPVFRMIDSRGGGHIAWAPFFLAAALVRIAFAVTTSNVRLLHVNVTERGSLARKGVIMGLAKLLRVPVVLHLHGAEFVQFYEGLPSVGQAFVRWVFRSAAGTVVLGERWRSFLIERIGCEAHRVTILFNAVPEPTHATLPATDDACRITFLGTLTPRKGVGDLISALGHDAMRQRRWAATFAGDGQMEGFKAQVEGLHLDDRVRFTGWLTRSATEALMASTDILVLPSYNEGLPMVILEALGRGIPVLTTPVGSIPEVLEDGRTALLVPPGDIDALAGALVRLLDDGGLRDTLSAAGRQLFMAQFSMPAYDQAMMGVYDRFVPDRGGAGFATVTAESPDRV